MAGEREDQLQRIILKMRQVTALVDRLDWENQTLKQENLKLKEQLNRKTEKLNEIQQQINRNRFPIEVSEENDGLDVQEMKSRIEGLVNEIDRCITLINQT
jgi:archaellum component FlaC